MAEYELHSLIADLFRDMRSMVEFWLSGTFAVIVARYVAGDALSRRTVLAMTALYLAATGLSLSQLITVFARNLDYQSQLSLLGREFFFPTWLVIPITIFQAALFVGGTTATVYFLLARRPPRHRRTPEPDPSAG